ncbi:3-isopropylmalate dehydratase small subunit [Methanolapillus millepedarum]|uniref:3-isopropylmalate dehydratase small subunit n=1 Tax=Methanolapillus millepedarum TaxID=3028296 RepID=A0AA96VFS4_9EURY|nr:2,3-dimethylmalate dehydratase small subunit [Methanosarcinaceae archaeon Ac7]
MASSNIFQGKAFKFGDDIDTDAIISGTCLIYNTPEELSKYTFCGVRPDFVSLVKPGDIVVGGNNFGCGSSREHAPLALIGSGVSCVIAKSFARIFFRNSINIGLPLIECTDADKISESDLLEVNLSAGTVKNLTKKEEYKSTPLPDFLMEIVNDGGLVKHVRQEIFE